MFICARLDWRNYTITIIDSEFEETTFDPWKAGQSDLDRVWNAMIDVYEKRDANIAANMVLMIKWFAKENSYNVNTVIGWISKYECYNDCKEEMDKYLMLI